MTIGVRRFLATEALYGIGIGLYSLALNLHLLALGASGGQIASISAVGILIMGIGALPAGMLAGKIGRKPMLLAGSMLVAAGAALFAAGRSLPVWYAAQAVASAGFMCIETTEIQLLFRYCRSRREESRAFHGMFAVFTAFTGLGNLLGGILSRADASAAGHAPSLYASAVCIAVLSLLRLRLLPAERAAGGSGGESSPAMGGPVAEAAAGAANGSCDAAEADSRGLTSRTTAPETATAGNRRQRMHPAAQRVAPRRSTHRAIARRSRPYQAGGGRRIRCRVCRRDSAGCSATGRSGCSPPTPA